MLPCLRPSSRVANHSCEITYQKYYLMPEFLELAHLFKEDCVADVYVRCCRVKPGLYFERPFFFDRFPELLKKLFFAYNLNSASLDCLKLFLRGKHGNYDNPLRST